MKNLICQYICQYGFIFKDAPESPVRLYLKFPFQLWWSIFIRTHNTEQNKAWGVFCKKVLLKILQNSQENAYVEICCRPPTCNFRAKFFSCEFAKTFKNILLQSTCRNYFWQNHSMNERRSKYRFFIWNYFSFFAIKEPREPLVIIKRKC